jgi:hypothetical protein
VRNAGSAPIHPANREPEFPKIALTAVPSHGAALYSDRSPNSYRKRESDRSVILEEKLRMRSLPIALKPKNKPTYKLIIRKKLNIPLSRV